MKHKKSIFETNKKNPKSMNMREALSVYTIFNRFKKIKRFHLFVCINFKPYLVCYVFVIYHMTGFHEKLYVYTFNYIPVFAIIKD